MKSRNTISLLSIAAALSVAAGAVLAVRTESAIRSCAARLSKLRADRDDLRSMQKDLDRYVEARRLFETADGSRAMELQEVLSAALPGVKVRDPRDTYAELPEGWVARRQEISLSDVPLNGVMAFVQAAERCRPPWRLMRCIIRGAAAPGTGNVDLTFEVIEKP